jgi:phosphoglycerol transferase MdoB-like AlkP superfamily enzyme
MTTLRYYFSSRSYKIRILIGSLFGAIVADGIITQFIIQKGLGKEGNPFLKYWVVEDKFLYIKILLGLLLALYLWNINRRHPKLSIYLSSIFLLGYTFILIWNLHFIL